jgi:hypothetical protein
LLAIDQDETAYPGDETGKRNDPGVALHQFEDALYETGQVLHSAVSQWL